MSRKKDIAKERLERAKEIASQVKAGVYQPPAFDAQASFFPPRPVIKKDPKAVAEIFGEKEDGE